MIMSTKSAFPKLFSVVFSLYFFFPIISSNKNFGNGLADKNFYVIDDAGISTNYEFGILKAEGGCDAKNKCSNGGACYNNVCICLPGTYGPLCETINGCSELNCGNATCDFDTKNFKAFCKCPFGQEFDYDDKKCKDCLCTDCKEGEKCFYNGQIKCEFINGKKTCTCSLPEYKLNPKKGICEFCSCGSSAIECNFNEEGNEDCWCKKGYAQLRSFCSECKCDNSGGCKFNDYTKVCLCSSGYVQYNNNCYKCSCGQHGKCTFEYDNWGYKQKGCDCDPGFYEDNKVCKEISECYCGENSICTLTKNGKNCICQEGFTNVNGLCSDINECDDPEACPKNMKCYNSIGSYDCWCVDGFQPSNNKTGKCEDIDECQSGEPCADSSTQCFNTIGSFRCVCKSGFATRDGIAANPTCESKSWKMGFGFLIGAFLAIIAVLAIFIYRKRA